MIDASAATAGLSFFVWVPFLGLTAIGLLWLLTLIVMQRPRRPGSPIVHRQFRPEPPRQAVHRQFRPAPPGRIPAFARDSQGMRGRLA